MFKDVGKQMCALAKIIFWVILGLACLGGLATRSFIGWFFMTVGGALSGWLSSFMLYAFGELVTNVKELRDMRYAEVVQRTQAQLAQQQAQQAQQAQPQTPPQQ